jgi:methylenetetrahydrofolate dehydrogenase (NADP+)/methenyltetrahydrofolate cyclohydrolase
VSALILNGRSVASQIAAELAPAIDQFRKHYGLAPTLAVVRVGHPPAAVSYSHSIDHAFHQAAMGFQMHVLPEDATQEQLMARIHDLTRADDVHGVLLQRPLPKTIDTPTILREFPILKDVEGTSPMNIGSLALDTGEYYPASTPCAAIEILNRYGIPIEGRRAVVVGRSNILGKPMALLLLRANATVMIAHSKTRDLSALTRQADLLIAAVGRAKLITAEMVMPGAVVIDFGVNRLDGQFVGDVDFDAVKEIASAITPVPGGTGPVTTMMLMRNTVQAAERQAKLVGTKGRIKWLPILKSPSRRK